MNVVIEHSAKGTSWTKKNHKYLKKVGTRYHYKKDEGSGRENAPDYSKMNSEELRSALYRANNRGRNLNSRLQTYKDLLAGATTEEDKARYKRLIGETEAEIDALSKETVIIGEALNKRVEDEENFREFSESPVNYVSRRIVRLVNKSLGHSGTTLIACGNGAYLMHSGVPGMKWGVRRYKNSDGSRG